MRLSGSDWLDSCAEGGETIFNGEVKRGRRSNGLRGLKGAIKKRPSRWGMTFVVGDSEAPELLTYLFPIRPCTRVSAANGLARLPAWAGLGDKVRDRVNAAPKIIRPTPFDLNRYFPQELSSSRCKAF